MSESKHTPGPWHWVIHDRSCASLGVGDDPGMGTPLVMSVSPCRSCADRVADGEWEWGRCTTPSEANARLIAAAPEMLEAVRKLANEVAGLKAFEHELRAVIGNTNWSVLMQRLAEAETTISKAKGEIK